MKKKEPVLAFVIGWLTGPFTFVYLGTKKPLRALIELLLILAIIYLAYSMTTSLLYLVVLLFVLGYALAGYFACKKQNMGLDKKIKG
ncbi:MAG: hypothetical protein GXY91_03265 [Clostridia bacterium]|nr:hypothetical protein [Clostridia bacterium]